jgi:HSP20 family protein
MSLLAKRRQSVPRLYDPLNNFWGDNFMDIWDQGNRTNTIPSVNIKEEKDSYRVEMAVPGMKKEDFDIDVDGNVMTISSEKESESKQDGEDDFARREYNYSCFSRSFTIPENADANKITAKYTDGVLRLSIAKNPNAQKEKRNQIKVE